MIAVSLLDNQLMYRAISMWYYEEDAAFFDTDDRMDGDSLTGTG